MTHLPELFRKFLEETISPEELLELQALILDEKNTLLLDELLQTTFMDPRMAEAGDHSLEQAFGSFMEKARAQGGKQSPVIPLRRRRWRSAAAAALFVLAGGGGFIYLRSRPRKVMPTPGSIPVAVKDVAPGRNHAILTLGGGQQVVLDSAVAGALPAQGKTLLDNKGGRLSYKGGTGSEEGVEILYNTVTTARGNQYQLALSDGTEVWLNAGSTLRFPAAFTGPERRVELTGEGYFAVAKDAEHPFVVAFGGADVKVLGTAFDVMSYPDETEAQATLVEGLVEVGQGKQVVTLQPGKAASVQGGEMVVKDVDVEAVTAWKDGQLSFVGLDLKSIMRQISRWYDVDVSYEGTVPDKRLGGIIGRNVNLSVIMDYLSLNGVHNRWEGKRITLLP